MRAPMQRSRRSILAALAALPPAALLAPRALLAQAPALEPTPACGDDTPTLSQTAGPYYKPASPQRRDLRSEFGRGKPIDLAGFVVDTHCRPLSDVLVEIWHADDSGTYDNAGFRLRGQQRTDAQGRWAFETIVTQHYSVRTAHYHFRVQRPGGRALITQLYFPDHPRNAGDGIFDSRLLMRMSQQVQRPHGRFDFVLAAV
jgi:protocatechuate 3,4-dioxygenase beta subunit